MFDPTTTPTTAGTAPASFQVSANVRIAWVVVGSITAVLTLLFGTVQAAGLIAHEERTERVTVDDPSVRVLDVGSDAGAVEVVGADVDEVTITARISDGLVATRFTHEVVGDRLQVRVRCRAVITGPWCRAGLRIVVPRDLEVKVRAMDDRVSIQGMAGRVDAESSNGTVEAEGLTGPVRLHSGNGAVRATRMRADSVQASSDNGAVRLEFDRAPLSVIADSDNGSVEVALPRGDQAYDVDIRSDNGSTDNSVHTDSTSDHRVVATSDNGSVTVRYLE